MKGRIQHPMYTAAALTEENPVLLAGEVVYESDTGRHKLGDGVKGWNALPYAGGGGNFEGNIPAEQVTQDATHRFATDDEKKTWNDKAAKDLSNVSLGKLFSNNGYYKAPDGLLLQWGYNTGGDSTGTITIYFPTTFYAVPYSVVTTVAFGAKNGRCIGFGEQQNRIVFYRPKKLCAECRSKSCGRTPVLDCHRPLEIKTTDSLIV